MNKTSFWAVISLAIGHLVTDLQAGALPIVLPHLKEMFSLMLFRISTYVIFHSRACFSKESGIGYCLGGLILKTNTSRC